MRGALTHPAYAEDQYEAWAQRYHDAGEVRRVGDISTPWPSWMIVAATALLRDGADARVEALLAALDNGVAHFVAHPDDAVAYIAANLDYTAADAREWLPTVRFAAGTRGIDRDVVRRCVDVLRVAGVLVEGKGLAPDDMVAISR